MARRNREENKETKVYDVKVLRATEHNENLYFDMKINGVTIYGCRFVEGKNGDFVSFPSHKGKDGKYYHYAYVDLDEAMVKLIDEQIDGVLK